MVREELYIHACRYAIGELARKGSTGFITSSDEGGQLITWVEVMEWLNREQQSEDAISRQAVFEAIDDCNSDGLKGIFCSYDDGERFKEYIKNLPPVTPRPKMGHWINKKPRWIPSLSMTIHDAYECSNCGEPGVHWWKHCINCGARMVEPREIHCNCTDEEIAKSFIEDVEVVKDLLPIAESEDKE